MITASFILNILIFVLIVIGLVMMVGGFGKDAVLFSKGVKAFKYFTVDSNVLAGIVSLIYALMLIPVLRGDADALPHWCMILKMLSTAAVALTMITVVVFLAPNEKKGYFCMFTGANFLFHFLIPVLCLVDYIVLVPENGITFAETLYGVLPAFLYAIAYAYNALSHAENGMVSKKYDWYGFIQGGTKYAVPATVIVLGASWGIAVLLRILRK